MSDPEVSEAGWGRLAARRHQGSFYWHFKERSQQESRRANLCNSPLVRREWTMWWDSISRFSARGRSSGRLV